MNLAINPPIHFFLLLTIPPRLKLLIVYGQQRLASRWSFQMLLMPGESLNKLAAFVFLCAHTQGLGMTHSEVTARFLLSVSSLRPPSSATFPPQASSVSQLQYSCLNTTLLTLSRQAIYVLLLTRFMCNLAAFCSVLQPFPVLPLPRLISL